MRVVIQLTTAGKDTGPFDLYSDVDNFETPFIEGVERLALELGYQSVLVPDDTTIIRLSSTGLCDVYTDIVIELIPIDCSELIGTAEQLPED